MARGPRTGGEVHGARPEAVIHGVVEMVNCHAGSVAQSDDITALCVKRAAER